jgi:hypothetical protein
MLVMLSWVRSLRLENAACASLKLVQLFAVAIDRQRHQRHRQQRQQGQLPADLRRHHNQHRAAHHQRVHQR